MDIKKLKVVLFLFTVSLYSGENNRENVKEKFKSKWMIAPWATIKFGDRVISAMNSEKIYVVPTGNDRSEKVKGDITVKTVKEFEKGADGSMVVAEIEELPLTEELVDAYKYLSLVGAATSFVQSINQGSLDEKGKQALKGLQKELGRLKDLTN